MFDEKAAAHMAVYLLRKNGAPMSHLKLMKLMYLSERTSLQDYANTISGDRLFPCHMARFFPPLWII